MIYDKLYKKDSKNNIRVWCMERDEDQYRTIAGIHEGAMVISEWKKAEPTNVGRSNERNAVEQAIFEVQATYDKKLSQGGYYLSISEINQTKYFEPMLAKKFAKISDWDNVYIQAKLDGMRCIATKDGLFTRKGKKIVSCPHIEESLKEFFQDNPSHILDGELYNHDLRDNFNRLMSICRKTKPSQGDLEESKEAIEYWLYDYPSVEKPHHERMIGLKEIRNKYLLKHDCIIITSTFRCKDQSDLDNHHSENLQDGFEGSIVRLSPEGSTYEAGKRSPNLLKWKAFIDDEYTIKRVEEGKGNRSGMAGSIIYTTDDGVEFGSGIRGGVDFNSKLWEKKDELVGATGTVRYFQLTPDGIPRFPVTVDIQFDCRED